MTGGITLEFEQEVNVETFYQEFRLNGQSVLVDWMLGASYFEEETKALAANNLIDTALGLGQLGQDAVRNLGESEAIGIYADATWNATQRLSVTGGLRWNQDKKGWCSNTLPGLSLISPGPTDGELCTTDTWDEWTPRLVFQYDLGDEVMAFVSVAKGYKGGGYNAFAVDTNFDGVADTIAPFDPETNIAYELGLKSTLADGRLRLNGNVFLNDYQDLQVQALAQYEGGGFLIRNAAGAETKGLELEAHYIPADGLTLMANYAFLNGEFTAGSYTGNDLPYSPEHTGSLAVNYDMNFLSGTVAWFAIYNYMDDHFYDSDNTYQEDAYGLLNGKVTYTPVRGNWDISIAADNITDESYGIFRVDFGLGQELNWGRTRLLRAEVNFQF